jgi:predicted RNA-binding Zn-ribbon protein involved in translation (DUF1610 family)
MKPMAKANRRATASLGVLAGSTSATAFACPDCQLGTAVRARIVAEGFWSNLVIVALPLLIVGAMAALLHRIGAPSTRGSKP